MGKMGRSTRSIAKERVNNNLFFGVVDVWLRQLSFCANSELFKPKDGQYEVKSSGQNGKLLFTRS